MKYEDNELVKQFVSKVNEVGLHNIQVITTEDYESTLNSFQLSQIGDYLEMKYPARNRCGCCLHNDIYVELACANAFGSGIQINVPSGTRLTKRFSKAVHKLWGISLTSQDLAYIGSIANAYATENKVYFDFDNNMGWNKGDFGDDGSCFWGCREDTRFFMQHNPRFYALRTFEESDMTYRKYPKGYRGIGRCWIMLSRFGIVLFNAYGSMQYRSMASLLHKWLNIPDSQVKDIEFTNNGCYDGDFWINAHGNASLICAKTETVTHINTRFNVNTGHRHYECANCGGEIDPEDDEMIDYDDEHYCATCFHSLYKTCPRCDCVYPEGSFITDKHTNEYGVPHLCFDCYHNVFKSCKHCGEVARKDHFIQLSWDEFVCPTCALKNISENPTYYGDGTSRVQRYADLIIKTYGGV